ncbi:MAG: hypothetical protein ACXACB_08590 [Promethearchaeota archaeon]|jgi:hypothetical protein
MNRSKAEKMKKIKNPSAKYKFFFLIMPCDKMLLRRKLIPLKRTEKTKTTIKMNAGDVVLNLESIKLHPGFSG